MRFPLFSKERSQKICRAPSWGRFWEVSLVEKKGELKDAQNALSKDFDVLSGPPIF